MQNLEKIKNLSFCFFRGIDFIAFGHVFSFFI
ncbi:hypothetical protein SGGBAA2069_c00160 [Streptococcus gallolyticus subsp. gallolyticus ATCC BAA-2069]|nr:hypothetical protein SGGBAA2069_c00160 [Streptococcus gallolyticus subsp. gallolyticus ATCC BAA-2069]